MPVTINPISDPEEIRAAAAAGAQPVASQNPAVEQPAAAPASSPTPVPTAAPVANPTQAAANIAAAGNALANSPNNASQLPIGVYIIGGLSLLTTVSGLVLGGAGSANYWILAIFNIVLALALISRSNLARQIFIIFAVLGLAFGVVGIMSLVKTQHEIDALNTTLHTDLEYDVRTSGKQPSASLQATITHADATRKHIDQLYFKSYVRLGLILVVLGGEIVYLTRPKVSAAFR